MPYYWSSHNLIIIQGETLTDQDGFFEVPFTTGMPPRPDAKVALHRITVKAVAPGGETCEGGKTLSAACEALTFSPKFDNEYRMDTLLLVNKSRAKTLTIAACNGDGVDQAIEGWYRLKLKGRVRAEGKFKFGEPVARDFAALPSGEYTLEYGADWPSGSQSGKSSVVLVSPDDPTCHVEREMFFYPVEEKDAIDFMVGTNADDLYLELEVFDAGKVVYREPLRLRRGARHIQLDYKAAWKDQVTVSLYGIKDMGVIENRHNFGRTVPSYNFEIKVGSLRDRTTPNTTETFTVEAPQGEMLISIYDITCDRYRKNDFYFSPIYEYYSIAPNVWSNLGGWGGPLYRGRGLMMSNSASVAGGSSCTVASTAYPAMPGRLSWSGMARAQSSIWSYVMSETCGVVESSMVAPLDAETLAGCCFISSRPRKNRKRSSKKRRRNTRSCPRPTSPRSTIPPRPTS